MRARVVMAVVVGCSTLLAGCSATVSGNGAGVTVIKGGVGPGIATPAPVPTGGTTTPAGPSTTPSAPPSSAAATAIVLPDNGNGFTFIQTRSGRTRCQVSETSAGCQLVFDQPRPRTESGDEANGVNVTSGGDLSYVLGNLGAIDPETLDYKTYTARGWFIVANEYGTAFTHRTTGHGMVVSSRGAEAF
ncbi:MULTISPECIES: hypothetical protein [Tsukamurella]|uniref:Lipoprotein LpqJ n=2 Tax=Tsukamurella TaxID=2060 RepID=A0A5C5RR63_9ACTN|nr:MULTISPECIES: hypothetical protein [Tsukamurella]NMD55625.1 hypothetical protein [Tsukamurella columbiensis]TWS25546.1 hypothetical protein FK530_22755 [Tsukamurella conjunctivitidis]